MFGPQGNRHISKFRTAVCIRRNRHRAGISDSFSIEGKPATGLFTIIEQNTELLILESKMQKISDEILVTTDDGSYGHHGFVTQILQRLIDEKNKIDIVFAIGPLFMMRAVCDLTRQYELSTMVSLNPIMVDGTGMCGACRVSIAGKNMFACVDGPEFNGHEVDFEELIRRNRAYFKEEKMAMEELTYHEGPRCYEV
jgi:ferredoxin--NADP+ reductase